jgi:hypothetical protein
MESLYRSLAMMITPVLILALGVPFFIFAGLAAVVERVIELVKRA